MAGRMTLGGVRGRRGAACGRRASRAAFGALTYGTSIEALILPIELRPVAGTPFDFTAGRMRSDGIRDAAAASTRGIDA